MLRSIGVAKLGAMAGLTAAVAGFFMYVMGMMTDAPKALLFSGLDPRDSSEIAARLETMKVSYELQADGATIMVPSDQVLRLRMQFAGDGIPAGGSVGYEIFDRSDAFGQTSFVQNVNLVRALEGELSRTIRSLSSIANARVHLNIPKHELFAQQQPEPTASVVLRARGTVAPGQVQAIQNLIASAVPGMKAALVTVIDEKGTMLGGGTSQSGASAVQHDERTVTFEDRVRKQVEDIVTGVAGPGRARVQVSADIDYNRITRQTETFDPDGQVVRSTQSTNADSTNQDGKGQTGVTVANALPAGAQDGGAGGAGSSQASDKRAEETINYEISKTTSTEIQEGGSIKRLSVAVAVDGSYTTDDKGTRTYQPRSTEEMQQIEQLVRSTIGFDEKRGDQLKVINLRFSQPEAEVLPPVEEPFLGLVKDDYWRIAQFGGLGLIALMLIFFVMRPLIASLGAPQAGNMMITQTMTGPGGTPVMMTGSGSGPAAVLGPPLSTGGGPTVIPMSGVQNMIDIAQVEGQVKESSVRKVGEIVTKHPDEATAILRTWLHQSA
ncbi:MAG: flagellar basal-body MS-ring/collar protein FliF [Micropepsaceae bacterium]